MHYTIDCFLVIYYGYITKGGNNMFNKAKKLTKEIWWIILLTGISSVLFGIIALFWPALTLVTLVFIASILLIVVGAIELFAALAKINKDRLWWLTLLVAILNIGIGVFLLKNPMVTATLFVWLLAISILARAIFDLVVASYADKDESRWLWIFTGIIGLIAAVAVVAYPIASSLAFTWVLGLYALIHGIATVAYAVQVRKDIKKLK